MRISQNGLALIKRFEGLRLKPYLCPAGVATIGYGSTVYPNGKAVTMRDADITETKADAILLATVEKYEAAVTRYVTQTLNQNQFDALVSFAYNVGISNLQRSTLLRKLNAGAFPLATIEWRKWVHADGKKLQGLVKRREAEMALFMREP